MLNHAPCSLLLQTNSLSCSIAGWFQDLISEHEQKTMETASQGNAGQNQLSLNFLGQMETQS